MPLSFPHSSSKDPPVMTAPPPFPISPPLVLGMVTIEASLFRAAGSRPPAEAIQTTYNTDSALLSCLLYTCKIVLAVCPSFLCPTPLSPGAQTAEHSQSMRTSLVEMMGTCTATALLALGLASPALANAHSAAPHPATTFAHCQKRTADPLEGCPEGTIYVSANDTRADFGKIQDAIVSIGNDSEPHYILIGAGFYYERERHPFQPRWWKP
jgi:hypothetical protein